MMINQPYFHLVKLKINLAFVFVLLVSLFGFFGCTKDIEKESINPFNVNSFERKESNPTVTNGMLHFNSFSDLEALIQSLQDKESDSILIREAYIELGVDVNAEYLPNLTDYPICLLKEISIGGYTSARKVEELVINDALNNGDDNVNSIVMFPFWKKVLNANYSVHVGNRIYKYYDNGGVAIVLNDDWSLYESIKMLPYDSLRESFNLIVTSDAREGWENYFNLDLEGVIQSHKMVFIPRFVTSLTAEGKYEIINVSLLETKNGGNTFKWIYADNSVSFGNSPNKAIGLTEAIQLFIDNGDGMQESYNGMESLLVCSTEGFTITYLSNNQIKFELPGFIPGSPTNNYTIKWVFSDGSTSSINPVIKTFTTNGTATCKLFDISDGTLACQFTKPYIVKCGDKKTISQTFIFTQSNQKWKLDGSIWVQTGQVGCKVKYLRWQGAILGWLPANNQGSCADLEGKYVREVYNPNKDCIDVTAYGSHCLGNGTYPTTVSHTISEVPSVFVKPGELSAGLGIKVNGTWRGWGYAGKPRLVLP
jgi:hypothetical protein